MPLALQDMIERRRILAAELATLDSLIESEALRLVRTVEKERDHIGEEQLDLSMFKDMVHRLQKQEENQPRKTKKPKHNGLRPPKQQKPIDYESIVSSIYEAYPETKGYNSKRLLAYIKDFGRQQNIVIEISDSRIRKLQAWKKQAVHRKSGNTRYGYDFANIPDEDDGWHEL